MFNLDTCKFVVWGYKNIYHTHTHIHEGFYRTLQLTDKQVIWADSSTKDYRNIDFSNTFFISEHDASKSLPIRDDCFYAVHGLNDDLPEKKRLSEAKHLSWNVYHDVSHSHGLGGGLLPNPTDKSEGYLIDTDVPYYPKENRIDMRWATDLIPAEIQKLKPSRVFRSDSQTIYWVGTVWWVNEKELAAFREACRENKISFITIGAGQKGVVSIEDNIEMVRRSYMAPAISGTHHITEGYAPCRIFKNISYGQYGITNSKRVNDIFDGKLIYNSDPKELFYEARYRLQEIKLSDLHNLMDEVASKHTYINRIGSLMKAARLILEK